jgi:hypothetical protein
MTARQIIQLTAASNEDPAGYLYALCDDGSVWVLQRPDARSSYWNRVPEISQNPRRREAACAEDFFQWMDQLNAEAVRRGYDGCWPLPDDVAHSPNCWIEVYRAGLTPAEALDQNYQSGK